MIVANNDVWDRRKQRRPKSTPNVLHIVGDSKFGGGGIVILQLAGLARRLGWHVDVLTTDAVLQGVLSERDVGVVDLDVIWRDIKPGRDLRGLYDLYRFLRRNDYDLVHTHTSKAGFVGRLAATLAGVPVVVHTVHGFAFHEESHPLALRFYSSLERMAARWCHRVVTVSQFHRRWALELNIGNAQRIVAIPNGIPEGRVVADVDPQDIRRDWAVAPGSLLILSAGRLAPQKGIEYLIRAVSILTNQLAVPFKVVLAGDGPLRPELERMVRDLGIEDKVLFAGFRKDIGNLLAASDLVVLPSLWEGLSIALLEAMAAGKPVVTTTIGSNVEVTRGEEAAILIPPKDAEALADAIARFAEDASTANVKAKNARAAYKACYTEDRMLEGYKALYNELFEAPDVVRHTTNSVSANELMKKLMDKAEV